MQILSIKRKNRGAHPVPLQGFRYAKVFTNRCEKMYDKYLNQGTLTKGELHSRFTKVTVKLVDDNDNSLERLF